MFSDILVAHRFRTACGALLLSLLLLLRLSQTEVICAAAGCVLDEVPSGYGTVSIVALSEMRRLTLCRVSKALCKAGYCVTDTLSCSSNDVAGCICDGTDALAKGVCCGS